MKPAPFEYLQPRSRAEAISLLAADPEDSKVISGGQSLVPMMNFRLARPARLIDITRVPGLDHITTRGDSLVIGSRVRHLTLERQDGTDPLSDLLRSAARLIGHLPIRTRGTFGGSLAHSDAASEWCLLARLLDARITVESSRGPRVIEAADFFESIFTTSMNPDELLVETELPALDDTHQTGFSEFSRRAGDFAIVAVATDLRIQDGIVQDARICIGGVSETPFRSRRAEEQLIGRAWPQDPASAAKAEAEAQDAAQAAASEVDPPSDGHGDAEYRRDLVRALTTRALVHGAERSEQRRRTVEATP